MLWIGLSIGADQSNAMKYFRRQTNDVLRKIGYELQPQGYESVLSEEQRERTAFEDVCEYIARNPERKQIVGPDEFKRYKFTDCLIPGAPEVHFADNQYWDTFWRIHSSIVSNGLIKTYENP